MIALARLSFGAVVVWRRSVAAALQPDLQIDLAGDEARLDHRAGDERVQAVIVMGVQKTVAEQPALEGLGMVAVRLQVVDRPLDVLDG
ncbi:MAG: hypothetical protein ACJA1L_003323, partial [Paracoccaceae bacterium]